MPSKQMFRTMQNGIKKGSLISLEEELSNTKSFDRFDDLSGRKLKRIVRAQDSRSTLKKQEPALFLANKKPKLSCSTKVSDLDNFYSDLGRAQAVPVKLAAVRGTGKKGVVQHAREIQKKQQQLELEKARINQEAKLKLQKQREAERIALEKMVKTVEFNDDLQVLRDFERLIGHRD